MFKKMLPPKQPKKNPPEKNESQRVKEWKKNGVLKVKKTIMLPKAKVMPKDIGNGAEAPPVDMNTPPQVVGEKDNPTI